MAEDLDASFESSGGCLEVRGTNDQNRLIR